MGADTWASYTPHACSPAAMLPLQEQVCSPRKVSYGEWKLGTGTRTAVEGGAESERVRSEQAVWPRGAHLTCRTGSHLLSCTSLAPRQWSIFRIVQTALRRGWPAQGTPGPTRRPSCSQLATLMLRLPVLSAALTVCFSLSEV